MHTHHSTLAYRSTLPLLPTCLAAIGPGFWAPEVIGDFQEGDARKFLEEMLHLKRSSVTVDDSAWAKVYEVRQASLRLSFAASRVLCCRTPSAPCCIIFHYEKDQYPRLL
jgi:hypothetical protein